VDFRAIFLKPSLLGSNTRRALTTGARMSDTPGDLQSHATPPDAPPSRIPSPAPTSESRARDRLAAAITAACHVHPDDDDRAASAELRSSVGDYVAALREHGATVEHAVISTKELLAEMIGGPNIPPERRALAEQVVSWGIDAYYDTPIRAD
jgi:hypothetical protein